MWNYSHSSAVHTDNCSFKCVWSFIVLLEGFFYSGVTFNFEQYAVNATDLHHARSQLYPCGKILLTAHLNILASCIYCIHI